MSSTKTSQSVVKEKSTGAGLRLFLVALSLFAILIGLSFYLGGPVKPEQLKIYANSNSCFYIKIKNRLNNPEIKTPIVKRLDIWLWEMECESSPKMAPLSEAQRSVIPK